MGRYALALILTGFFALTACGPEEAELEEAREIETTPAPAAGSFEALDGDGDSYLDADEMAEWVDDEGIFTAWDIDPDSELDADEINEGVFRVWDGNDDDRITEMEWETGVDFFYSDDLDSGHFQDWDLNGDSELDMDEVAEGLDATEWNEAWYTDDDPVIDHDGFFDRYFTLWDRDEDGVIDRAEHSDASNYIIF